MAIPKDCEEEELIRKGIFSPSENRNLILLVGISEWYKEEEEGWQRVALTMGASKNRARRRKDVGLLWGMIRTGWYMIHS